MEFSSYINSRENEELPSINGNVFKNFFEVEFVAKLKEEITQQLKLERGENDLRSMSQSAELSTVGTLPPALAHFVHLLKTDVRKLVEKVYQFDSDERITVTASKYGYGDYLLCHDDRLHDRHIAFVFYLSPNWNPEDGGKLRFFSHNTGSTEPSAEYEAIIPPEFNSFMTFKVTLTSHHEVEEVYGAQPRLSLNGWYHSKNHQNKHSDKAQKNTRAFYQKSELFGFKHKELYPQDYSIEDNLKGKVHPTYYKYYRNDLKEIRHTLEDTYAFHGKCFLEPSFYEMVAKELSNPDLPWKLVGPSYRRKYMTLPIRKSDTPKGARLVMDVDGQKHSSLDDLLSILVSPLWLSFLCTITKLDLAILEEGQTPPLCMAEVQRWAQGSYTLEADDDIMRKYKWIEVTMFFNVSPELADEPLAKHSDWDRNNSGHFVQQVDNTEQYFKKLFELKCTRLFIDNKKPTQSRKERKLMSRRIKRCVSDKVRQLESYRTRHGMVLPGSTFYLEPASNDVTFTINSSVATKYLSYIRRRDADTCFHSVTLTYLSSAGL